MKPLDGGSPRLLVSLPGGDGVPSWSPDGSRIAFADQTQDGVRQIWIVNADGTGLRQLTDTQAINSDPDWSPDGTQLAYVSGEPTADPYAMRPDGTEYEGFPDWQAVTPLADVAIRQRPRQRSAHVGEDVAIDITAENRGTATATSVRVLVAVWPPDTEVEFDDGPFCSGRLPVRCALGSIPPGESVQLVLHVRAPRPGRVVGVVQGGAASADGAPSNNRSIARVRIVAGAPGP